MHKLLAHIGSIDACTHASVPYGRKTLTLTPNYMVEMALDHNGFGHWKIVSREMKNKEPVQHALQFFLRLDLQKPQVVRAREEAKSVGNRQTKYSFPIPGLQFSGLAPHNVLSWLCLYSHSLKQIETDCLRLSFPGRLKTVQNVQNMQNHSEGYL